MALVISQVQAHYQDQENSHEDNKTVQLFCLRGKTARCNMIQVIINTKALIRGYILQQHDYLKHLKSFMKTGNCPLKGSYIALLLKMDICTLGLGLGRENSRQR